MLDTAAATVIPMRLAALLFVIICLAAPGAEAGAWPRQKGDGFASVSVRLGWPQDVREWISLEPTRDYSTLYVEYGLTDRLTLGLDLGHSVSGAGKTVAFLQYPLRRADTGPKVTGQLGFGVISGKEVVRPGVSLGWGLEKGWISVDSVAEAYLQTGHVDYKVDFTWGRNIGKNGHKLILQLQTGQPDARAPFARLAPSLVVPVRGRFKVETGVTIGLTGDKSVGLKLGLWTNF
ncbi:hypothetical protein [Antarctobacter jejuensis]|uniref:hypothetical protein n=1 Tax=Antarctobacter jejuensis TaxID=1439938 RepID=UPI003FD1E721